MVSIASFLKKVSNVHSPGEQNPPAQKKKPNWPTLSEVILLPLNVELLVGSSQLFTLFTANDSTLEKKL